MKWKISFYNEKVMQGILKWPVGIGTKFTHIADLIEKHGAIEVGMPFVRAMGSKLYEIRAKGKEGIGRAFFCIKANKEIIILHEFIKKTERTPAKELLIARKRLSEMCNE